MKDYFDFSSFDKMLTLLFPLGFAARDCPIYIKPNLMTFVHLDFLNYTSPILINYLIDYLGKMGFNDISIIESNNMFHATWNGHNVRAVAERLGIKGNVINLSEEDKTKYKYKDREYEMPSLLDRKSHDFYLINFAKLKSHTHFGITCAVKNMYGCLPEPDKYVVFHKKQWLGDAIAAIHSFVQPNMTLIDAVQAQDIFVDFPEKKHLHKFIHHGMMYASVNPLILDEYFANCLKINILDYSFYKELRAFYNCSVSDNDSITWEILGDNPPSLDLFHVPSVFSQKRWHLIDKLPVPKSFMNAGMQKLLESKEHDDVIFNSARSPKKNGFTIKNLSLLIASRDIISTETLLSDFLAIPCFFFDVDFLIERYFELHYLLQSCLALEDGHRIIRELRQDWQKIDAAFDAMIDFLSPKEIQEYFPSDEIFLATVSLIKGIRNSLHDRIFPGNPSSPDNTMLPAQSLQLIKRHLFYPVLASRDATTEYTPPKLDEVLRVKESLFFTMPGMLKPFYFISTFLEIPFLNMKRKIPSIMRTITHLARNSPSLFTYFIPRWGEPVVGTRGGEITLPSRKEIYFFFHDWQFILDDFEFFKDLQRMRQLKNAWYGQRLGMHMTAQDLSWLL